MKVRLPRDAEITELAPTKKKTTRVVGILMSDELIQSLPKPDMTVAKSDSELMFKSISMSIKPTSSNSERRQSIEKMMSEHSKERKWIQEKIEEIEYHLASAKDTIAFSKTVQSELKNECSKLKERIERAKEKLWRLPQEITRAKSEIEKVSAELSQSLSNTRREKLENKLTNWQSKLDRYESESESTSDKLERLQVELADTLAEIDNNNEAQGNIEVQVEEMEDTLKRFNERLEILMRPYFYIRRNDKGDIVVSTANVAECMDAKSVLRWSERLHRIVTQNGWKVTKNEFYELVKFAAITESYDEDKVMIVRDSNTDDYMSLIRALTDRNSTQKK